MKAILDFLREKFLIWIVMWAIAVFVFLGKDFTFKDFLSMAIFPISLMWLAYIGAIGAVLEMFKKEEVHVRVKPIKQKLMQISEMEKLKRDKREQEIPYEILERKKANERKSSDIQLAALKNRKP